MNENKKYSNYMLMLGAGLMQKPAIDAAHKNGFFVYLVDANPNALCVPFADHFEPIDLKDRAALANYAKKIQAEHGLHAVFTAGTDFSASVSYVAQECGLSAHSFEAALNATDKARMRQCFKDANVPSPLFTEADAETLKTFKNAHNEAEKSNKSPVLAQILKINVDFPMVVKPVDNMGARGCVTVRNFAELFAAVEDAIKYSRTGRAIIEEYMDGPEFSIDSLVLDGKIIITGFADRHIFYPPYFIEMGHTMSSAVTKQQRDEVFKVFAQGVKALGLSKGCAKGDMKLTKKGGMIGEIAARLSGGYMSGWTFPYASGVNLTEQAFFIAAGEVPSLFLPENLAKMEKVAENVWYFVPENFSAERAWISIPGVVKTVYGMEDAAKTENIKDVFPRIQAGDAVNFPLNNVEKCGNCISQAESLEKAVAASENAVAKILLRLEPNNAQTEGFLTSKSDFPPNAFEVCIADFEKIDEINSSEKIDFSTDWAKQVPAFLQKYLDEKDWNHRQMRQILGEIGKFAPDFALNARIFWKYLIRGSIQGVLYAFDSGLGR